MITVNGDQATVTTLLESLVRPTAIKPAGDTVGDRRADKAIGIPLPY
jgi:hypothetical protein